MKPSRRRDTGRSSRRGATAGRSPGRQARGGSPGREPDFRALFQAVPGLCLALTPDLRVVAASDAYLRATRTRREEILGRGIMDLFGSGPESREIGGMAHLKRSLESVIRNRRPDSIAVLKYGALRERAGRGEPQERLWSIVNSPVLGEDGSITYLVHRVEDVTLLARRGRLAAGSRRPAGAHAGPGGTEADVLSGAEELLAMNRRLAEANSELEALSRRLHQFDELKTRFFANVSHELRTPLSLLLGPVRRILERGGLEEPDRRDLKTVEANALALLKHVNDLLDVSRLEAGKMAPGYQEIDLAGLVRETATHFEGVARDHGFRYVVEAPPRLEARLDPDKIRRVLMNLLTNAFKFTPAGGTIRCCLHRVQGAESGPGAGRAILTVSDSGPGVPPELRTAVFTRFFQVEPSATRSFSGTGLGLAIAKEFVEVHQGRISVGEAAEGGAAITVELPLEPAPEASAGGTPRGAEPRADEVLRYCLAELAPPGEGPPREVPGEGAHDESAPLILVVEDNVEMNRHIRETLAPDYRTVAAFSGDEGLAKAKETRPDLILSDEMMPGMTGGQMTRRIREIPELESVPIVILTARADESLRLSLLRGGVQDCLIKPFSGAELTARIRNLVSAKRARDLLETEVASRKESLEELAANLASRSRELARSNEELRQFAYIASHDLQEPLRMVSSFVRLLADRYRGRLDGEADEFIHFAVDGAERMQRMITDLLAYCRAGSGEPDAAEVESEEALSQAVENLLPSIREAKAVVTHDPLPRVNAEACLLAQVFQNLIGNALKFRGEEPPRIHVSARREGGEWVFSVRDNGIGIDPRHAERIFVIFQRLHAREKYPGSGIGLSICQRILSRHGGKIWVEPALGRGATFRFTLPAGTGPQPARFVPPAESFCRPFGGAMAPIPPGRVPAPRSP